MYSEELVNCDGSDAILISSQSCSIPIATLRAAPYDLPWGSSIQVKLTATNAYGDSQQSTVGNGAVILTNPDAPVNLANNAAVTTSTQIGLTWDEGEANGGAPVTDYRVSYDQASGLYVTLASGVTVTSYIATGLEAGRNYKFKVEAHNEFGYSEYSSKVGVLAAEEPAQPAAPTTLIQGGNVKITWAEPNTMGSPIIAYRIMVRHSDGISFTEDTTNCDGSTPALVSAKTCTVPISVVKAAPYS